jgi:arabinan endo-1,5-alpha-L-arabinosidase
VAPVRWAAASSPRDRRGRAARRKFLGAGGIPARGPPVTGGLLRTGRGEWGVRASAAPAGPYRPVGDAPLICVPGGAGGIGPQASFDADGALFPPDQSDAAAGGSPATLRLPKAAVDGVTFQGPRTQPLGTGINAEHAGVEAPSVVPHSPPSALFPWGHTFRSPGSHTFYAVAAALGEPSARSGGVPRSSTGPDGAVQPPAGSDVVGEHIFLHGRLDTDRRAQGCSPCRSCSRTGRRR